MQGDPDAHSNMLDVPFAMLLSCSGRLSKPRPWEGRRVFCCELPGEMLC